MVVDSRPREVAVTNWHNAAAFQVAGHPGQLENNGVGIVESGDTPCARRDVGLARPGVVMQLQGRQNLGRIVGRKAVQGCVVDAGS